RIHRAVASSRRATTRSNADCSSRPRHPTHVRTGVCRAGGRVGPERTASSILHAGRVRPLLRPARLLRPPPLLLLLGVGPDVDLPAGEAVGEPGVLALAPDREGQLVVRHDDPDLT